MNIDELKIKINNYNLGTTYRGWIMRNDALSYSNVYLSVVRIDTSNRWIGPNKMSKMWSIIFNKKENFMHLNKYCILKDNFRVNVTPVIKGKNKGCYGLRIYDMKKDPDVNIIKEILDFIFS